MSTNKKAWELNRLIRKHIPFMISTVNQTAGKGQRGNIWVSEAGKNITCSFVVYPVFLKPDKQFFISMAVFLALVDLLAEKALKAQIKWPNDIYVEGEKIAGILIEHASDSKSIRCSVIGIGMNVNQSSFPKNTGRPVSMKMLTGKEYELSTVLSDLEDKIIRQMNRLSTGVYKQIKQEYEEKMMYMNTACAFKTERGIISGKIVSVDKEGKLLIKKEDGQIQAFTMEEIKLLC